jgi:uncharacterized protein (TIGR03382 family)
MRASQALLALTVAVAAVPAAARIGFQNNVPNGAGFSCLLCHNSSGGGARDGWNAFGDTLFVENGGDADDPDTIDVDGGEFAFWNAAICEADSDGDGASNGAELGDPDCVWEVGEDPAQVDGITDPNDPQSVPVVTPEQGGCSTTGPAGVSLAVLLALLGARRRR